jgi:hydroxymethyl cephem carbamoyltransferase
MSPTVLAFKPGHDGCVALVHDGELVFSLEGEKDSFDRHDPLSAPLLAEALLRTPVAPDAIAIGGWHKVLPGRLSGMTGGYRGLGPGTLHEARVFGRDTAVYTSSHERSHLFGGVAMSPFDSERELAVLVWEGVIGSFYRWHGSRIEPSCRPVLDQPGARFSALYNLADPAFADEGQWPLGREAGKLMALAGLADGEAPAADSVHVVESLLTIRSLYPFHKARYRRSGLYNCGVTDPEVCRAARYLTRRLFEVYRDAARELFEPGLPLVISGGCGLNCDWNTAWREDGYFSDVFVPPCTNDSGSAIGTAVDAAVQLGGAATVRWDVYRGEEFVHDADPRQHGWEARPYDPLGLSRVIDGGAVVAWVQGRYEIGPRALGHRSLLASASDRASHDRLNTIKQRESYRPIAPICLDTDLGKWFDRDHPDPHMLYFRVVRDPERLPAVTHADGTARAQGLRRADEPRLYELLGAHREQTGAGVLCNTSLNFKGKGFINRTSDLLDYCTLTGITEAVIEDRWYRATGDPA